MKKIVLALLIVFSTAVFSQSTYTDEAGKWRIGLNAGAMWQTCDVTPHANIAGGFTIEKILNKKSDAIIGFALGLRYLSGHCTGFDTKASYGVANNTALNGTFDAQTDYAHNGGIFYNNYKTYIHEGALELKVNFPKFEQKTNLILYVMGGVGICNYKTWINALDANGNRYDFTALQNAQSVTAADVKKVMNGTYSTLAQGSSPSGTNRFTPSVGIGFGFKLSRVLSLVFEYRAAFQRTNLLDGVTYNNFNDPIKQNDFYNYASANLLFTICGKAKKSPYSNTASNVTNYTQPQSNNTVYTNQQQPIQQQQPVYNQAPQTVYTNQQQVYPPYVNITYPQNNFSSNGDYVTVQATIQNIQSAQQVSISQNGYPVHYFTYDSYSGNLHFQTFLQQGANNIIITANSPYGTGSQGVVVFYNPPYAPNDNNNPVTTNPNYSGNETPVNTLPTNTVTPPNHSPLVITIKKPVVQYINPSVSPYDVTTAMFNVTASVQNVGAANQINVSFNGNTVSTFNYDAPSKTVSFTANLLTGYNSVNISASNVAGTDSKSTVIDYKPVGRPPRIDIFNPATSPFTSANQNMTVNGYVYNISSASDIAINYNGNNISFNYNNATHEIDVPVNLSSNSNQLQITATNTFGNDVKQIILLMNSNLGHPHMGTIITPTLQTQVTPTATLTSTPHFGNVQTEIPVIMHAQIYNGDPVTNNTGNSTSNGSTTGTVNGMGAHHNKPEFLLTSPNINPYTSMSGMISISANLNFVSDVSKVSITYNGAPVSFSYNPVISEYLSFTSPLRPGSNTFVIDASNQFGAITESIEINYIPTNPNSNPNGSPALHFTGGTNNTTNTPRIFNNVNTVNPTPTTLPTTTPSNPVKLPQGVGRPMRPR